MRFLHMEKNWNQVPSSPAGRSPAARALSASHAAAFSSSRVPASLPRKWSPAISKMSVLMSCWRMAAKAGGVWAFVMEQVSIADAMRRVQ